MYANKDRGQKKKRVTEDEMAGCHHWLSGHEFEQTLGAGEGQGSLVCCSPWGRKELDMTGPLDTSNNSKGEAACSIYKALLSTWDESVIMLDFENVKKEKNSNFTAIVTVFREFTNGEDRNEDC